MFGLELLLEMGKEDVDSREFCKIDPLFLILLISD